MATESVGGIYSAKVPGGWLVRVQLGGSGDGITVYPGPDHIWDGNIHPIVSLKFAFGLQFQ